MAELGGDQTGPGPTDGLCRIANGEAVALARLPVLAADAFHRAVVEACGASARLAAMAVLPGPPGERTILAVLAEDAKARLALVGTAVPAAGADLAALTADLPQAQAFERELCEQHGIRFADHPWCKPLRRHADLEGTAVGEDLHPFYRVEGAGIHEVAVGPVHAGIIEPGHFRFQCHGETVLHLEIQLGYQHRGACALMLRGSPARRLAVAETVAGDTTVGHGLAHCMALEALAGVPVPPRADELRAIMLELERLANHVGDLGALCNDVGYLPGAAWLGRLRGEFLNLSLEICGSRFGRGLLVLGGVRFDFPPELQAGFLQRLGAAEADLEHILDLVFDAPAVTSRFEGTGVLDRQLALAIGLVGPASRASGCPRDVRQDHPFGAYRRFRIEPALTSSGGVMARAQIRARECRASIAFVRARVLAMTAGALAAPLPPLRPHHLAVALTEGWRGEIVHLAATGAAGVLDAYQIVDPSFHNWLGLALALRGNQISDFPLCNKSFNLSYAGHDL
jgi:Ni,Fe-hydrogenase III large subunit